MTLAVVYSDTGAVKTAFQGNVSLGLGANPGGSSLGGATTKAAANGVVSFSGLTLSNPGANYTIVATAAGPASTTTAPFSVTASTTPPPQAPTPPRIASASVVYTRKLNARGKPVGKPIFSGFAFQFNTAMNAIAAGNPGNYQVQIKVQQRQPRKKPVTVLQPIGFAASFTRQPTRSYSSRRAASRSSTLGAR